MNVLFFQDTLGVSGGEIWVLDAATRLQEKGHSVSLGLPSGSWLERRAEVRGIPYFDYLIEEEFEGSLRWLLTEHLREREIDLIYCSIPGFREEVPLLDAAVREAGRGRILVRLGVTPGPGALTPERIGLGFQTVGGIVAVSDDIKTRLLRAFPALPPEQVHVIYNGVDLARFSPAAFSVEDHDLLRAAFDIPSGHAVIGTLCRLDPIKNLPLFIQAACSVLDRFPETTFLIAGEGNEKEGLMEMAAATGVLDNCRFAGFVEDVPRFLHSLDILVHPSLSEGVPGAILEAMAMGKPVVATRVGGVPEVVEHGKTGLLVPPGDGAGLTEALCGLLDSPDRRAALGRAARRRVETRHDRRLKIEELEALFSAEILRGAPADGPQAVRADELHDLPELYFARGCAHQNVRP